jgi:protein-L-isoaspartate(D-aspartate) O-methyltransferase
MNFEQARFNMVEQQVRPWEVLDERVLELLETTQREDFVPVRYRKMAFTDMAIPLDHEQSMMKPVVEGRLLQALELKPDETVLEIGTGSGFITACLAQMAKSVVSVDIHEQFSKEAAAKLKEKGIQNVERPDGNQNRHMTWSWLPALLKTSLISFVVGLTPVAVCLSSVANHRRWKQSC